MEIILKEDIIGLGYKNDIVNVKAGYGRNYLLPTGKAIMATPSAKKVLAENLRQQARKLAAIKEAADKKAQTLNDVSLVIEMKVSANGVTYGSVNAAMIAAELQKKGFDVDRKIITMHDAKALGDYVAHVHLHKEVEVEIPVKVVAENAAQAPVEEAPKVEETAAVEEAPQVEEAVETAEEAEAPVEE